MGILNVWYLYLFSLNHQMNIEEIMEQFSHCNEMDDLQLTPRKKCPLKGRLSKHSHLHNSEQFCPSESYIHHANHHQGNG